MELNKVLLRIIELMNFRNWTLYRLSKESDIPYSSLSSMFKKNNQPTIATLGKICDGFNISMAEFFADDNDKTNHIGYTDEDNKLILEVHKLDNHDRQLLARFVQILKEKQQGVFENTFCYLYIPVKPLHERTGPITGPAM